MALPMLTMAQMVAISSLQPKVSLASSVLPSWGSSGNSGMRRPSLVSSPAARAQAGRQRVTPPLHARGLQASASQPWPAAARKPSAHRQHAAQVRQQGRAWQATLLRGARAASLRTLVVQRAQRVELLQRPQQRDRRRRVHEVKVDEVVDAQRLLSSSTTLAKLVRWISGTVLSSISFCAAAAQRVTHVGAGPLGWGGPGTKRASSWQLERHCYRAANWQY
jgi:hypothetical protein